MTRTFKSNTLSNVAGNLLRDRTSPFDLMDNIDSDFVLDSIKKMLDILEKDEQMVEADADHAYQIREYLLLLDLIIEIDQLHFPNANNAKKKVAISQPGLRYAQTEALIQSLLLDEKFNTLSATERKRVIRIRKVTMLPTISDFPTAIVL